MSPEREGVLEIKSPEQKRKMVMELGGSLHDEWRAPRKKDDGTFESRVKVLAKTETGEEKWFDEGKVPATAQEIRRQDIANTAFEDLDPYWQGENKTAAEVAMGEVFRATENGQNLDESFIEQASDVVHTKWLERNKWVFHPDYGNPDQAKPFKDLSEEEKEKDRAQIRKAIEIFKAN